MVMTRAERSERARKAAFALHAKYDSKVITAPGRAAFLSRFNGDAAARKAYFRDLATKSVQVRRRMAQERRTPV